MKRVDKYYWPFYLALFFLSIANSHAGQGGWLSIVLPGILLFIAYKFMSDCFPFIGKTFRFFFHLLTYLPLFPRQRKTKDKTTTGARSMQPRINFRR